MSKDIRSYFSVLSTNSKKPITARPSPSIKRNKPLVISSDEDVIPETPVQQKKKEKIFKKRKIQLLSSDSEEDKPCPVKISKQSNKEKAPSMKPAKAADIFGSGPIKQAKVPDRPKITITSETNEVKVEKSHKRKKKKLLETEKFEDKQFEATLLDLDDEFLSENMDILDESIKIAENKLCDKKIVSDESKNKSPEKCENKVSGATNEKAQLSVTSKCIESISNGEVSKNVVFNQDIHKSPDKCENKVSDATNKRALLSVNTSNSIEHITNGNISIDFNKQLNDTGKDETLKGKRKAETYDPDADVDRYEKKRQSAILYQKYLNRSGPANHGSKDIPKGKPDCLRNLSFIRTGILDSLNNEEFEMLIKNHGGRVVHSVSKKVNYVVSGEEPGPAKIEKAKGYGIKIISEDDILDLIRTKSGLKQNSDRDTHSLDDLINGLNQVESEATTSNKSKSRSNCTTEVTKLNSSSNLNSSTAVNGLRKLNNGTNTESSTSSYFNKGKTKSEVESSTLHIPVKSKVHPEPKYSKHECLSWTEKYKPTNIKSIIGQQGDNSNMRRLLTWLEKWFKNHGSKNKPKLTKPSPWAKNDDGSYFKAALLSGPPGIGKTTTAHLVARELGFDVVEFNASDTRSKRLLQEELAQLLTTTSLAGYFTEGVAPTKKHVLLMDEVDGMAGNEDRGGMQELINLIKSSSIPIICMCNDRNHPKVRSLVNYCYDLRFSKPRLEQIKGAMMSVCFKEGININPNALSEIIVAAGMDIRQILTNLCIWSAGKKSFKCRNNHSRCK